MGYKDFFKTTGALWWKNTTYYRQKIYRVNSANSYYIATLKYLSSSTKSKTTTRSDTQTYSATLTKKDKAGYYTWEARINFDKYRLNVYKKNSSGKYNTYVGSGYYCSFKSQNPYYYLAYTKNCVN